MRFPRYAKPKPGDRVASVGKAVPL